MLRLKLHWQILIALAIGILYGLLFPSSYFISDKAVTALKKTGIPESTIIEIKSLRNVKYENLAAFRENLMEKLGNEKFKAYSSQIVKASYYNPPVKAISWLGDIFLKALKMLIIPLVVSSLISGITNIGSGKNLGRLGLKTIGYYLMTSLLAIFTGLFLVNLVKPGVGADINLVQHVEGLVENQRGFSDTLLNIIPENIVKSAVEGDLLSIIFFSILVGFFITRISQRYQILLTDLFNSMFEVMMKITMWVILFTPLGIFGIIAKVVSDQDDLISLMSSMGLYMGTVILALAFHFFISLPLIVRFVGHSKPFRHLVNMGSPLLTAFSTSSSGATLPLTMTAVEENSGVSNKISSFTLPLGATINMDGTALYECVAVLFIAQAYGLELSFPEQLIVVITALLVSIGAAGIPMAGLVMITIILTAVNLPLEGVGLILAVDRILDMFRTATNVWSDSCGAVIIAKSEGEVLKV